MRAATPQLDESEQRYVFCVKYWGVLGHRQIAFGEAASPLEVSSVSGDLGDERDVQRLFIGVVEWRTRG